MKKMILMAVAMLSMTTAIFAANEENEAKANAAAVYNMSVNLNSVADALDLTIDQAAAFVDINKNFTSDMELAAQANVADRKVLIEKAINKDLKYMKSILTKSQYRKYLLLLNTTLNNRGIEK